MRAEKDKKTGKWKIQYSYTDWTGKYIRTTKRGFETKREAEAWLREYLQTHEGKLDMTFDAFVRTKYLPDMECRIRKSTMKTKQHIIRDKLLPYFGQKKMNSITPADIREWQGLMLRKGYTQTYLRTISNQLTAIFNYAARYYNLSDNPSRRAGIMGKNKAENIPFWTKEEFQQFSDAIIDKHESWLAFNILYYTGMRLGELLALTVGDIDVNRKTIRIDKSLQRIDGEDVITPPKTAKGTRTIWIPKRLADDIADYIDRIYDPQEGDRLLLISKHFMENEIKRGIEKSGVRRIHIHCLRHSHCALLINMGFPLVDIAERLGHEKIDVTWLYSHSMPGKQEKMAAQLNEIYKGMSHEPNGVEEQDDSIYGHGD